MRRNARRGRPPNLSAPILEQYTELYNSIRTLWAPRERGRYGAVVEPMLQWVKVRTITEDRQVIPCQAGKLTGVVYANGDVSLCEAREPLGNLRQNTFPEIWHSDEAKRVRESVAHRECHCTTEVFLWSSIVYRPDQLVHGLVGGRVWRKPSGLSAAELEARQDG